MSHSRQFRPHQAVSVKGGAKIDHWGGKKVDHFPGSWCFVLKDLRGGWSVGLRPALRGAFRPERKPALQIGAVFPAG